jgi:hypothetical protein
MTIATYRLQPVGGGKGGKKKKKKKVKSVPRRGKLHTASIQPILTKPQRLKTLHSIARQVVEGVHPSSSSSSSSSKKKKASIHSYTGGYENEQALESQMSKVLEHKKMLDFTKWKLFSQLFARHLAKQVQERFQPKTVQIYDKATIRADKRKSLQAVKQEADALLNSKEQKDRAAYIINRISTIDPNQFYWNSVGRIVYMNKVVHNSNISELVADAAITKREPGTLKGRKPPQQDIPGWEEFKDVIHASGIPRSQIGNQSRYYTMAEWASKKEHMPETERESGLMSFTGSSLASKMSPRKTRAMTAVEKAAAEKAVISTPTSRAQQREYDDDAAGPSGYVPSPPYSTPSKSPGAYPGATGSGMRRGRRRRGGAARRAAPPTPRVGASILRRGGIKTPQKWISL